MGEIRVHQPSDSSEFEIGDILYLGSQNGRVNYYKEYKNAFYVCEVPLITNSSRQDRLHGWLGSFNDVGNYAEGKARVSNLAASSHGCDCSSPECNGHALWVTRVGDHRVIHFDGEDHEDGDF